MRSPTELLDRLLEGIERELDATVALRERLHAMPELAHQEHETSRAIAAELPGEVRAAAGTGLLAQIGTGERPVAVRAELDGLPVREQTGAPFSARGDAMHACGHDVHMAALVALARAAASLGEVLPAPLLVVLQPSEEAYPSGAELLVPELRTLTPRALLGAHVHPELAWQTVALDAGPVNASCDLIEIEILGATTHGAYPHHGKDPVLALSEVVVAMHAALGRTIDPLHPATLTIGLLEAGSAENVIPAVARARGALRAHDPADREALREMAMQVVAGVAAAHGCEGRVKLSPGEPALENDASIVAAARPMLERIGCSPAPQWRSCGSDDLAFFGELCPLAMAFVGLEGASGFKARPLHHPELLPPPAAVGAVARTLAVLYVAAASLPG